MTLYMVWKQVWKTNGMMKKLFERLVLRCFNYN